MMLALMRTNPNTTELFLPTGETVPVPAEVLGQGPESKALEFANLWALKAGLIDHKAFLANRDLIAPCKVVLDEPLYM